MTSRKIKPGSYDDFTKAFMEGSGDWPEGWVRFHQVRNTEDENEIVSFGFFDGSLDELRAQGQEGYDEQMERIKPFVESVGLDGVFEVLVEEKRPGG